MMHYKSFGFGPGNMGVMVLAAILRTPFTVAFTNEKVMQVKH
jgi:hypothetical protein